jgi:hypothetical protein
MNRTLKRIGSRLRRRLSPDGTPLSSDAQPPDRMTEAEYRAFKKTRDMLNPWLGISVARSRATTRRPHPARAGAPRP